MLTDSAFALRSFRRSPGWAFVTVLTIALGVGASTAVFSVADRFLIRPLPYRDASRVYAASLEGTVWMLLSTEREWQRSARTIEAAEPYGPVTRAFLHGDLNDVQVTAAKVDASEVALGTVVGLAGALGVTRLARTMVSGVHGFDTSTYILAAVSVLLASLTACAEPLFRATRVDPTVAIRGE